MDSGCRNHIQQASGIFKTVLEQLIGKGIHYCLLRNYEFLEDTSPFRGGDIDILVKRQQLRDIEDTLLGNGFFRQSNISGNLIYAIYLYDLKTLFLIHLYTDDLRWNGVLYLKGDRLFARRINGHLLCVLSDEDRLLMMLLHCILDKKGFSDKDKRILVELSTKKMDRCYILKTLKGVMGDEKAIRILQLLEERQYNGLIELRWIIIRRLLINSPMDMWNLTGYLYKSRIGKRIKRFIKGAPLISFIGPDGSGKTTMVKELQKVLGKNWVNAKIIYMGRWQEHILPLYRWARKKNNKDQSDVEMDVELKLKQKPIKSVNRSLYWVIREIAYMTEYYLRYLLRIYPAKRQYDIVLTDRYAYDLLMDVHSSGISRQLLCYMYPKPALIFYLWGDVEVLYARKKEQSQEELYRQMEAIESLREDFNLIKAPSDHFDFLTGKVAESIFKELSKR